MSTNVRGFFAFRRFSDYILTGASVGVLSVALISYGELKEWRKQEENRVVKVESQTEKIVDVLNDLKVSIKVQAKESKDNREMIKTQTAYLKTISENLVDLRDIERLEMQFRDLKEQMGTGKTCYKTINLAEN